MKRYLSFLFAFCLFVLCACASEPEEIMPYPEFDDEVELHLEGLHFRHGSYWDVQFFQSVGYSSPGDKIRARCRELEEKYGCTYEFVNWEDGSAKIMSSYAAGVEPVDVLDSHADAGGYSLYRAGALLALDDLPGVDVTDEKWGTEAFRQYGTYDGKSYGFYQYAWEYMPEYAGILLFNGELLRKAALPYPYEYQEAGKWTWANFKSMLEDCSKGFSYEEHIRPCVSTSVLFDTEALIFSNGGSMVIQDGSGKYVTDIENERAYQAIEYITDLYNANLYSSQGMDPFMNSLAVFVGCESYYGTHHDEMGALPGDVLENFGFIQFPYGPMGSPEIPTGFVHAHRRMNWVIGLTEKAPEEIGAVLDFVFAPFDDLGGWKGYAESVVFHHQEGYENYAYQLDNINYNYAVQARVFQTTSYFQDAVLGRMTPAEAMAKLSSEAQAQLDENINDLESQLK